MVSRMPPASPAATMLTYSCENALGCLAKASASVLPASTSKTTARVTSLSFGVLGLLRQDVQRLHQRQAGVDHRRELPREDHDVAGADPAARHGELDLLAAPRGWRPGAAGSSGGAPITSSRWRRRGVPFMIWPVVAFLAVYSKTGMAALRSMRIARDRLLFHRRLADRAQELVLVRRRRGGTRPRRPRGSCTAGTARRSCVCMPCFLPACISE